ncbi:MAG: serine hydrolase [Xanthobacteraceae bacterium]
MRTVIWGLIAVFAALTVTTTEADARRARHGKVVHSRATVHHRASRAVARYSPPYSAIVVDANSGAILHETSADSLRHPASLTKIMTLYLLFEQLEAGKLKLSSELDVSAHASAQSPSKLGLKPGQEIRVEDAIRALVTKSANDVAVVIAESLADDETAFARLMTRKAQALGMRHTLYRNASGLPNDEQITTARDQALLGRAIQDRFPKYYRYFSTPSFTYRGHEMRNHNHLLGRVDGVDGIKTGYVAASGFNLVTSVRRGNRHLVAVVLGGRTAGARDARMRELISEHIVTASVRRTAPPIVEVADNNVRTSRERATTPSNVAARMVATTEAAPAISSSNVPEMAPAIIRNEPAITAATPTTAASEAGDELKPIPVKTVKVKASTLQTAAIGSIPPSPVRPTVEPVAQIKPPITTASIQAPAPQSVAEPVVQALPARSVEVETITPARAGAVVASIEPIKPAAAEPAQPVPTEARDRPAPERTAAPQRTTHTGWIIQVGALETVEAANQRISVARSKAINILGRADAFTEPVVKDDKTLHRARFAGFDKDRAEAACRALKRAEIVCMAIKN